jgi:tetratricopeptide (TPR) repeat protein
MAAGAFAADDAASMERASKLERERRWEDAGRAWHEVGGDAKTRYREGLVWQMGGRSDAAREAFLQLIRESPNSDQAAKARFSLALLAQKQGDFGEMEDWLSWFLDAPLTTVRRPEALWLLGGHYLSTRADRWAAYGCFDILRQDHPDHDHLRMADAQWKEVAAMGDLELWSRVQVRWGRVGKVPDFIPLFLLSSKEVARVKPPSSPPKP